MTVMKIMNNDDDVDQDGGYKNWDARRGGRMTNNWDNNNDHDVYGDTGGGCESREKYKRYDNHQQEESSNKCDDYSDDENNDVFEKEVETQAKINKKRQAQHLHDGRVNTCSQLGKK